MGDGKVGLNCLRENICRSQDVADVTDEEHCHHSLSAVRAQEDIIRDCQEQMESMMDSCDTATSSRSGSAQFRQDHMSQSVLSNQKYNYSKLASEGVHRYHLQTGTKTRDESAHDGAQECIWHHEAITREPIDCTSRHMVPVDSKASTASSCERPGKTRPPRVEYKSLSSFSFRDYASDDEHQRLVKACARERDQLIRDYQDRACSDDEGDTEALDEMAIVGKSPNLEPCPELGWQYIDGQGHMQGPFTLEQMRLWHEYNMLPQSLQMRCHPNDRFSTFDDLFPKPLRPFEDNVRRCCCLEDVSSKSD